MSTATPEAPEKAASTEKEKSTKDPANGTTGKLPLKGGKDGVTKGLDNRTVIKAPADPKVLKAGEKLVEILDRQYKIVEEAKAAGLELYKALKASKKARKIRIPGEAKAYWFSVETGSKLKIEKKDANES